MNVSIWNDDIQGGCNWAYKINYARYPDERTYKSAYYLRDALRDKYGI
jgi:hypothetical protein